MAKDIVCGKEVDQKSIFTTKATKWLYEGKWYYFCSAGCRVKFMGDPTKYLQAAEETGAVP